jgi:hypothetical protein
MDHISNRNWRQSNSYRIQPGDVELARYEAAATHESAVLFLPPGCQRMKINIDKLNRSDWWQRLKHRLLENDVNELAIVSEILVANCWAQDYRPAGLPNGAVYVVSMDHEQDPFTPKMREQFQFRFNSTSGNAQRSTQDVPYTVLAKKERVQRRRLGAFGAWCNTVRAYLQSWILI